MTAKPRKGLDHRAYRRAKNRLRKDSNVCHLCGNEIDRDLPYTDPWSWTADHLEARSKGGALLGKLLPAHRSCNSARGNKDLDEVKGTQLRTSRQW